MSLFIILSQVYVFTFITKLTLSKYEEPTSSQDF